MSPEGGGPACHDEVCVTCSDAAVAVPVLWVGEHGLATVATEAGPEEISVALVDARPGDVVLVHAKEALAVVARAGSTASEPS
jgi:hydrogenase expression/formation protein HypC